MASEYCYSIEMRRALERQERQEAEVIPILLRPVLHTDAPFAKLQMLPTNGKPIVEWRDRDSAFFDIACGIEKVAQKYSALPPFPPYAEAGTQQPAEPTQFATPDGQGIPSLEIQTNIPGEKPTTYDLTKSVINIGRDSSNDIVIDAPVVSHFHAQIVREGNQLLLIHPPPLQSHTTNGLLYQGRHILGNELFRKPLVRGDIFRIGNEHGTLVTLTYHDGREVPQDTVHEIRPLPAGAPVSTPGSQSPHQQAQSLGPPPVPVRVGQRTSQAPLPLRRFSTRLHLVLTVGLILLLIISSGIVYNTTILQPKQSHLQATATAQAHATATALPTSTPIVTPTATALPTSTPIVTPIPTGAPAPTLIIILGLLLLVGVIAALIAIGAAIRAKIGQRRAQDAREAARKRRYYEEAIEAYRRALSRNPLDADALQGMGNALYALGYYDQALDAFTRAIDCDSTPAAYARLGDVFARLKRYSEAVSAYEKAIELDPTVTLNYGDFMRSLRALGRKEEAERVHTRAKQLGYEDDS